MFMEFLNQLLTAVLIAAVPVLTGFITQILKKKSSEIVERTDNERIDWLVVLAEDIVVKSVQYTNQTYVDTLKKCGAFDVDAQKQAFKLSFDRSKSLLTQASQEAVSIVYGSVDEWIKTQIEANVQEVK